MAPGVDNIGLEVNKHERVVVCSQILMGIIGLRKLEHWSKRIYVLLWDIILGYNNC